MVGPPCLVRKPMSKKVLIASYGTPQDRLRAQALAGAMKTSQSALLISLLRAQYKLLFGETDPTEVVENKP